MTVRFLTSWNGYSAGDRATLAGATETALIAGGIARADYVQDGPVIAYPPNADYAAAVVAAGSGMTASEISAREAAASLFRWISGDAATAAAVTTAASVTSDAIDVSSVQDGSMFVVHTGGTLAISYSVSADGLQWTAATPLAASLSAGTYAALLSAIKLDAGFFRLTYTATGSTCNVKAFFCATSANTRSATRQVTRAVFGDAAAAVALASGGTIVSPPIDLARCVRSKSTLKISVASGTVKISAAVSRDGYSDLYSLGDIATGLTAGTHTVELSALLQYGHFVTFTVTETAATTASVNGWALLAVADEHVASGDVRKVAVIAPRLGFAGVSWTTNYARSSMSMYSMLARMGYDVEFIPFDDASTILDSGARTHEFFVWAATAHNSDWTTWTSGAAKPLGRLLKGEVAVPLFAIGVTSNNNAALLASMGAGTRDTESARKILIGPGNIPFYTSGAGTYAVTVQAHMSSFETIATDSAAAGKMAWAYSGPKGRVYVGTGFNGNADSNMFPILFARAISAGVVDQPPRKLTAVIDIDDMPDCSGSNGIATVADLDRVYRAMQALNMPCSFGIRPEDIVGGRQSAEVSAFVASRTADRGGLIYPIAHSGLWMWKDGTKVEKDAEYREDVATIRAAGISIATDDAQLDAWGYTYFNNNALDEETTQLGQIARGVVASTDNLSQRGGYGWRVIRADALGGNNTESMGEPSFVFGQTRHRGMRVVASTVQISSAQKALDFDDGSTGTSQVGLQCTRFIHHTLAYGMPFYFHGSNCYDGHDSGNAPGTRWLELLVGMHQYGFSEFVDYVHGAVLAGEA